MRNLKFSGHFAMIGTDQARVGATAQGQHAAPNFNLQNTVFGCSELQIEDENLVRSFMVWGVRLIYNVLWRELKFPFEFLRWTCRPTRAA
jgi:hypothetical protein